MERSDYDIFKATPIIHDEGKKVSVEITPKNPVMSREYVIITRINVGYIYDHFISITETKAKEKIETFVELPHAIENFSVTVELYRRKKNKGQTFLKFFGAHHVSSWSHEYYEIH